MEYRKKKKTPPAVKTDLYEKKDNTNVKNTEAGERKKLPDDISNEAKVVYSALNEQGVHIDDIVRVTNLKMNIVLSSLTELELYGFVELESGKKYKTV